MSVMPQPTPASERDLHLSRLIHAPRDKVYRAWTEAALLQQWFTPRPWTVAQVETDVRPGGASLVVMCSPEGLEFPSRGVYLEVVPNRRLVFTDAYTCAWEPAAKPFMTVILTFDDAAEGQETRYTALVRHWTVADRETHEKMGFHEGWAKATDQLAELAASL
ncbi:MAG TPA: SRPBCC family protein [Azospira sp.]|nr:SRPBCC family protein [Azospira sp.]